MSILIHASPVGVIIRRWPNWTRVNLRKVLARALDQRRYENLCPNLSRVGDWLVSLDAVRIRSTIRATSPVSIIASKNRLFVRGSDSLANRRQSNLTVTSPFKITISIDFLFEEDNSRFGGRPFRFPASEWIHIEINFYLSKRESATFHKSPSSNANGWLSTRIRAGTVA